MVPTPADPRWDLEDEKRYESTDHLFNWLTPGEEVFCCLLFSGRNVNPVENVSSR
jgi:hypothetical protein